MHITHTHIYIYLFTYPIQLNFTLNHISTHLASENLHPRHTVGSRSYPQSPCLVSSRGAPPARELAAEGSWLGMQISGVKKHEKMRTLWGFHHKKR